LVQAGYSKQEIENLLNIKMPWFFQLKLNIEPRI
jgi:hypothetical protein